MPCYEAEVYRLSPYSKQITKSMGIEYMFNMYNQIIVYFNYRSMRISITVFLRGGSHYGHYSYGKQAIKNKFTFCKCGQIKEFSSDKKYMYTSCIMKTIHLVIKNICIFFFNLRFLLTLMFIITIYYINNHVN